jgi:hypothetical protein
LPIAFSRTPISSVVKFLAVPCRHSLIILLTRLSSPCQGPGALCSTLLIASLQPCLSFSRQSIVSCRLHARVRNL